MFLYLTFNSIFQNILTGSRSFILRYSADSSDNWIGEINKTPLEKIHWSGEALLYKYKLYMSSTAFADKLFDEVLLF